MRQGVGVNVRVIHSHSIRGSSTAGLAFRFIANERPTRTFLSCPSQASAPPTHVHYVFLRNTYE